LRLRDDIELTATSHEQRATRKEVEVAGHPAFGFTDSFGNGPQFAGVRSNQGQDAIGFAVIVTLEDNAFRPVDP
jgi:hypothetical protein